ncbi:DsbA family protein [Bacillus aerolatus]|uniref:ClpXP adapter protein SpxH n=1 Tax=Bacillus aerolatus TaxID=2653354 RepID=A0A6I1FCX6_9BACI|nr:ClpXP adapter SpxH family protein [Bacillus aerolatus]KAB7705051.1 DsbA family protein [Bacillus aerolatus]
MCSTQQKPLEIYMFVDPLCPECWALEPFIRKLHIEYGRYFRLKQVLTGSLATLNLQKHKCESISQKWDASAARSGMSCDGTLWIDQPVSSPFLASIAIKAAELQGRRAGSRFLRKVQEVLFIGKQNISDLAVLTDCAKEAGLDKVEFLNDIHSSSAAKAFQCDLKISSEMEVEEAPTLVFFNENIEEEGIKITGLYSYDIYVQILEEMLEEIPEPQSPPSLEDFLKQFRFTATKEISEVYNWTENEVEREMKKLLLQRKVRKVPVKFGSIWEYIN